MKKKTGLPFICKSCGYRWGDKQGPKLLEANGDVPRITVTDNRMQCPRCGTMNQQALPNGTYKIRDGRWEVVRQVAEDILSTQPTPADVAKLAELVKEAQAKGDNVEQVAASIESQTPFRDLAKTIRKYSREHPPGWGAWVLAIIIPYIISFILGVLHGGSPSEPAVQGTHTQVVQQLSPQQIDQIAQQVANDFEKKHQGNHHPSRPPGRNEQCWCGSGLKYKKCCGDPAKRTSAASPR